MKALALLFLLIAAPVSAEPTPLRWSSHAALADALSNAGVYSQIGLAVAHDLRTDHQMAALSCTGAQLGIAVGAAMLTKLVIHRLRPDGSDDKSFFSQHTATAMSLAGWNLRIGIPLATATGYLRQAAGKHYASDVGVGAMAGYLASLVCR